MKTGIMSILFVIGILLTTTSFTVSCKNDDSKKYAPINVVEDNPVTDIDGDTYKTVKIGSKVWMAENFKAIKTAAGLDLQGVYVYADNNSNASAYGRLYTWPAAVHATPTGWHLPTKEVIRLIGGTSVAGGKLKETGMTHWNAPNTGATNSVGFTAVGGGFRGSDGIFYTLGEHGSYWGTANNTQFPFCIYIYHNYSNVATEVSPIDITSGIAFAVRYVKD